MRLILLGAPGVGKGTQAKIIMKNHHIPQISTGDILRNEISRKTRLGEKVQKILESGQLVPDNIILQIVENRLSQSDCKNGFILDGFPRTIPQAEGLNAIVNKITDNHHHLKVVEISLPESMIIARLTSRRICSRCGKDYNLRLNPPPADGKCTRCGGEIIQRDDDKEETIRKRLQVYQEQTQPLIGYYQDKKLYKKIDGSQPIETVYHQIEDFLKN